MDQHQLAFIEEANELLPQLEDSLLALEEDPGDSELVNTVFRALHTIKGSGSMFGFDEIEHFTHDLENAFELVRSGAFSATPELIDLTLAARDEIQHLVRIAEEDLPDGNKGKRSCILQDLQKLLNTDALGNVPANGDTLLDQKDDPETDLPSSAPLETYCIRFRPEPQAFAHGSDPLLLLAELRDLGLCSIESHLDDVPSLESLDPESCYMSWTITLQTSAGENAIKDVFIFVGDDCELDIEKVNSSVSGISEPLSVVQEPEISAFAPPSDEKLTEQKKPVVLKKKKSAATIQSTVRVPSERLDKMVNLVGEMVIAQARLSRLGVQSRNAEIASVAEEIERLTADMRDSVMSMRMVPIGSVFGKYKRLVRDLARDLGKHVEIETSGGETELDKTVIEQLHDPMVHLIRNAIDHGIESPETRKAANKPPMGCIRLSGVHSGAYVLISITDDGGGLDRDRIFARAIDHGLTTAGAELSDRQIYDFILQPGFSTKESVSALSGRGVGMDVVARGIQQLGGRIQIDSKRGFGSTITLRLPLTLAIIDGLQIRCDDADYVLPVGSIEECVEMTNTELTRDRYRRVLNLRGEMVPYISLRELFEAEPGHPDHEKIVIINDDGNRFGIVVDVVVGELQAVIKPLGKLCRDLAEISGATILGDGTVALILDMAHIFEDVRIKEESVKSGLLACGSY